MHSSMYLTLSSLGAPLLMSSHVSGVSSLVKDRHAGLAACQVALMPVLTSLMQVGLRRGKLSACVRVCRIGAKLNGML